MKAWLNRVFKIRENGSTISTEILAGLSIFMTMAYIFVLNPNILTNFGADGGQPLWNAVFMATCIASAIGTIVMGIWANKPFAMASGMGLNNYFVAVVVQITTFTGVSYVEGFQAGLCIILLEGILFLALSLGNIREKLVKAIPEGIRHGIGPAIGLMLMNIALGSNAGLYNADGNCFYVLRDFFAGLSAAVTKGEMGDAFVPMVISAVTILVGFITILMLSRAGVKGAVLFGMLGASVLYYGLEAIFLKINPFASLSDYSFVPPLSDMVELTLFKFNFRSLMSCGVVTVVTMIISYCIIDMFDTLGTFVGMATAGGMVDDKGEMPQMREALAADAVGTIAGAVAGTSTVTSFVESAAGVKAGGRTGLTAVVTGLLFLLVMFLSPVVALIPAPATSAALLFVGVSMFSGLSLIRWDDWMETVPVAVMCIAMPISGSVGTGIGLGFIVYCAMCLASGRPGRAHGICYAVAAVFLVKFFVPIG